MPPKNIYIIGAQCTGKTTLVNALKDHFTRFREQDVTEPIVISELARNVLQKLNINREEIASSPEKSLKLQTAILKAQHKAETEANGQFIISDRSGIDPIVYTRLSVSENAAQDLLASTEWDELERNMKDGLVFVCEAGCTWLVDDGTRWMPTDLEHWNRFDQAFRKLLSERAIEYGIVQRDVTQIDERVKLVVDAN